MESLNPISVIVRNERGVLARVAGLFARRGFNIISLAVGETEDARFSRITVVVQGTEAILDQVVKQLKRLVSVIKVSDLSRAAKVERGLALIKVNANPQNRHEIVELANIFRARIDHVDLDSLIVEVSGDRGKIEALIDVLRPYGVIEMARTGQIVLGRHTSLANGKPEKVLRQYPGVPAAVKDSGIYNVRHASKER
jgi:acetolactate synthase-1/3 small subunit